jgi:hypothetical protein
MKTSNAAAALPRRYVRWAVALAGAALAGCAAPVNRVALVAVGEDGATSAYAETFDEAYYRDPARPPWDIVLRSARPTESDPSRTVEQVLHLQLFWRAIPGTTHAESTQTNALVTYCLMSDADAVSYEGAGFVYLRIDRRRGTVEGLIESSSLARARQAGAARDSFGRCRLTGSFIARCDPSRVSELLGRVSSRLGPRAPRPMPAGDDDPR